MLGSLLQIKPVLTIQGEKLDTCSKARGMKSAFKIMVEHLKEDLDTRFREYAENGELAVGMAYTYRSEEEKAQWQEKLQAEFPDLPFYVDRMSCRPRCSWSRSDPYASLRSHLRMAF